jgi:general secretion pathway protein D
LRCVQACGGILFPIIVLLSISGCLTLEDGTTTPAATFAATNSWERVPRARLDDGKNRKGLAPFAASADKPLGETTYLEGTGRFVGEQRLHARSFAPEANEDPVTLNLVNVPAPQAAKTVLGDMFGIKYTVDPGIEGKITIQTPNPVSRSTIIDLFQAALRANNAALVKTNGQYRIVPIDQAAVGATIKVSGPADIEERLGSRVQVVQLRYVAASEIRRILEPISPRNSIIRTDDARQTITLSGTEEEIAGILDAISVFDVDVMRGMSFAIVPVKTSQPAAIADELKHVFASDREGPMSRMVQFLPNKRLGAILIISPQPRYLARAEAWARKFDDHAAGSEKQFFTYEVQNRPAQELVDALQSMFATELGAGRSGIAGRNVAPRYQEARLQSSGSQSSLGTSGGSSSLGMSGGGQPFGGSAGGFGSAGGLGSTGGFAQTQGGQFGAGLAPGPGASRTSQQSAFTSAADTAVPAPGGGEDSAEAPRIKIVADDSKNAILMEATLADYRRLMKVIETLDVVTNQVLIDATIAEITLNDDLKFGVRWSLQGKRASYSFTDDAAGAISSVFPGFSYAVKAANLAGSLNALNAITNVNVISSPSLTIAANKTAMLQVGDQVPITTQSAVSVLTTGAPLVNSVSYRDTGVILSITPRINKSGRVLLDIEQEVSSVVPTTSSEINSPTIRQRRVRTTVMLNDGEGLALGGMIQTNKSVANTQIPIIGDLPLLGNAFKQKDNQLGKTELIIIITPHVIRNLDEARAVTDEFRRQLSVHIPRNRGQTRSFEETIRRTFE